MALDNDERVRELEISLRRIGTEVCAAGLADHIWGLSALDDLPDLPELTARVGGHGRGPGLLPV